MENECTKDGNPNVVDYWKEKRVTVVKDLGRGLRGIEYMVSKTARFLRCMGIGMISWSTENMMVWEGG